MRHIRGSPVRMGIFPGSGAIKDPHEIIPEQGDAGGVHLVKPAG